MAQSDYCQHLLISGKVQGVWYRDSTRKQAESLGVNGWVRNLDDGRVEALMQGEQRSVEALISWCHDGPARARVDEIVRQACPLDEEEPYEGFEVRR
uniref:acylphosphatase n=1 Tax=Magnetococcus massalia (strain MO-1) TaxID=451514 RepID=A0A1S7LCE6_MAGMO|nr:Acylphosphatase [Candidatus Magnetococcus massalia]